MSDRLSEQLNTKLPTTRSVIKTVKQQLDNPHQGLLTGITGLDEKLCGLHPEELVTVGGFPGLGKSAWMGTVALHMMQEHRVLVCSLELSLPMMLRRYICTLARVSYADLCYNGLPPEEMHRRDAAMQRLEQHDKNLLLYGGFLTTLRLQQMVEHHKPEIVFIDRLEYVTTATGVGSEWKERDTVCAELRDIAIHQQLSVVVLAQLNVASQEVAADANALLHTEFRGSKGIRQYSQCTLLLNRPSYFTKEKEDTSAEIIVSKNNNGPCGSVKCSFDGRYFLWRDATETEIGQEWSASETTTGASDNTQEW
jgi:replicative DNA helicase